MRVGVAHCPDEDHNVRDDVAKQDRTAKAGEEAEGRWKAARGAESCRSLLFENKKEAGT